MPEGHIACETCGSPTRMHGTKRCDSCWTVESQLAVYLRGGGVNARVFVAGALRAALQDAGHQTHAGVSEG